MVIFRSPSKHVMLWNTEVKIHNQENSMCTCLVKGNGWPSCDTFLGHGLELSFSFHPTGKQSRILLMRRSWSRSCTRLPPARIFGSGMMETWPPPQLVISPRARGIILYGDLLRDNFVDVYDAEHSNASSDLTDKNKFAHIVPLTSKHNSSDLEFEEKHFYNDTTSGTFRGSNQPVEEPWLLQSSASSPYGGDTEASSGLITEDRIINFITSDLGESDSINGTTLYPLSYSKGDDTLDSKNFEPQRSKPKIYHPVEEPWLFQQSILASVSENEEYVKQEAVDLQSRAHNLQTSEKMSVVVEGREPLRLDVAKQELSEHLRLLLEKEIRSSLKNCVSTVILVNSSLCTMQRIAVLEDDKLVELLLEPVKDIVQCDSVYLGVVTKLVPRMEGAFVNIGCSRPSLMDIKRNQKPFIFPPFHQHIKQSGVNSSLLGDPVVNGIENNSFDVEAVDDESIDDSVEYMQGTFGEHETGDELDVSEALTENMNGSVVGSEVEIDLEKGLDQLDERKKNKKKKNAHKVKSNWKQVQVGTKIIVQVAKEGLGTKGPTVTPYPSLRSRFWIFLTGIKRVGVSKKISGKERTRLREIANKLKPQGFGLTVRTVAAGRSCEELQKDLEGLLSTWNVILEHAKSAAHAADEGVDSAVPVLLHKAMDQTLSVVQDYFNDKVKSMVVDSPRTYNEITNYLQDISPDLCNRVELYRKRTPLFDEYNIEEEVNNMLSKRVSLSNGGYLVIEQTEALVSIDVNGGHCVLAQGTSQEKAVFEVNLVAATQIARQIRLRDIGGLIVVDFIDMWDDTKKRDVYEVIKKAVARDRSVVKVSELSKNGLMEITRKRVRESVTFMFSEPCSCCHGTGRVEALETSFSKIEREISRLLAIMDPKADPGNPRSWPRFVLMVDQYMCDYLTSGKRTRLDFLSSSLKVWIHLQVARGFARGAFEVEVFTDDKDNKNKKQVAVSLARKRKVGTRAPKAKVTFFPIKKGKIGRK